MEGFGQRLKESIKKSDFTQKELAKMINISEDSMSLYVKEKKFPDVQKVFAICNLLHIEPNYLIIGKNSDLTKEEEQLLRYYRNCTQDNQTIILNAAKGMQKEPESSKSLGSKIG